jgi:tetratricopeptide (TPR) repeat protein
LAQEIVEERLQQGHETPRMWTALGDLTRNPEHYQRAIDLSKGRYSRAYIALGLYHFEHVNKQRTPPIAAIAEGDEQQQQDGQQEPQPQPTNHLELALSNYQAALAIRPLNAAVWFRVGTICMQLKQWEKALQAFSNVVQQEPEAAEAWANVAAIHMHNRQPTEAYPALVESLKHARHNWRVWVSKLYTCLDLSKYDEAIQACQVILDLQSSRPSENIPPPEEKCIRAIVAGTVRIFHEKSVNTTTNGNAGVHDSSSEQNGQQQHEAGLDSARRTLSRVHALLDRMASLAQSSSSSSSSSSQQQQQQQQSWIFQLLAAFHEQISQDNDKVLEYLMQDYRSLQDVKGWELDNHQVQKMCSVVSHICDIRRQPSQPQQEKQQQQRKEGLVKARMLVRGVVKKIRAARTDDGYFPDNVNRLEELLVEIEKELAEQNVQ